MLLIDTGAIAEMKRRMQAATDPPPAIQPMPQARIQAPMPPPLAQPPQPSFPLAEEAAPVRFISRGEKLQNSLFGQAELPSELQPFFKPSEQQALRPGLLSTLTNSLIGGYGRGEVMKNRALMALDEKDALAKRRDAATLKEQMAALRKEAVEGRMPFEEFAQRMVMLNPDLGAPFAGMLNATRVAPQKAESPIPNMSWVPDGKGGYRQLGSPADKPPIIREFVDGIKASYDNGRTWEKIGDARHPEASSASEPLTAIEGPDGNPVLVPRSQAVGQKPYSAGVGSAINQSSKARMVAAVGEMNNAHNGMAEFEKGLANGTIKISASAQLLQRLANSFTHDDPVSQFTQSAALAALNRSDPALARYIRRGLSFAEGESMISQRPSDFRTKMAAFLSTAASGASPELVSDISGRRWAILSPLNDVVLHKPKADAPKKKLSPSDLAKAKTDADFAAWAKANGYEVP